jgi:hypothetical protein
MSNATERENGLLRLVWPVAAAAVVLTAVAPFVVGSADVRGVAIGGALATLNLAAIALVVRGVMRGALLSWGSLATVKFAVLLFATYIVIKNHWAGVLPLALGYAALPLGIVVGQLLRTAPERREEGRVDARTR